MRLDDIPIIIPSNRFTTLSVEEVDNHLPVFPGAVERPWDPIPELGHSRAVSGCQSEEHRLVDNVIMEKAQIVQKI